MTKKVMTILPAFIAVTFLTAFSAGASASSTSTLKMHIVPIQCWLETVETGSGQSVYITPEQCAKEEIAREAEKYLAGNWLLDPSAQSVYSPEFTSNNALVVDKSEPGEEFRQEHNKTTVELTNELPDASTGVAWWWLLIVVLSALIALLMIKRHARNRASTRD